MGLSFSPAPAGPVDAGKAPTLPALRVEYATTTIDSVLVQHDVLAVIGFGESAPARADPRRLHVPLVPESHALEIWRARGRVESSGDGPLRVSSADDYAFVAIELDERDFGGVAEATRAAYAMLDAWRVRSTTPHLLRTWNYIDAINLGAGDDERYRRFCAGRAAGMNAATTAGYPAASAIGVRDGSRRLRLHALAARQPGLTVENPRQVSAWRYPRQYGPVAPGFARGMRAPTHSPQLYISGTAAVVGHASHHTGDVAAQVDETLANLDSLRHAAGSAEPLGGPHSVLRVYVRHAADVTIVRERLLARLGADTPLLVLLGDICRAELLVEIDGVHHA